MGWRLFGRHDDNGEKQEGAAAPGAAAAQPGPPPAGPTTTAGAATGPGPPSGSAVRPPSNAAAVAPAAPSGSSTTGDRVRRRLAVASPDEHVGATIREACSGAFIVDVLRDEGDLVAELGRQAPTLFILDTAVRSADWPAILRRARQTPGLRRMVTLVLASQDDLDRYETAHRLGAADVIAKPAAIDDVRVRIEGALARQRAGTEGRQRLGDMLLASGAVTPAQLDKALADQREDGGRLGAILVRREVVTEAQLAGALAHQMRIGCVDLLQTAPAATAVGLLPREFIMRHRVLPLRVDDRDNLILAMTDPLDVVALDEAALRTGKRVVPATCTESGFDEAVAVYFSTHGKLQADEDHHHPVTEASHAADGEQPVVETVDSLISDAVGMNASDIHLQPGPETLTARCRIDGVLHPLREYPLTLMPGIVNRLKVMGNMNIAERRLPQEGRASFETSSGRRVDLLLTSVPCRHGENVAIRLQEISPTIPSLDALGLHGVEHERYRAAAAMPQGGIIVSGPTGSGKSTTLYATLETINDAGRKIYTVEDPVERTIPGIVQTEVKDSIGLTFARVLHSLVRADPDVIMVGEVRDVETARIVADAAVSGHLVFTTVHAGDAAAAVHRLIEMGLPSYVVAAAFRCIVGQRLVRRLCTHCRRPTTLGDEMWRRLGLSGPPEGHPHVYEPAGCSSCFGTGYLGRIGLFEVLTLDDELRSVLTDGGPVADIRSIAAARGFKTIRQDGIGKVLDGTTSHLEILRVTL